MAKKASLPAELFERARAHPDRVAMRRKRLGLWEELSWRDYERSVRAVALGLIELGVEPGQAVGLISENRVEWLWCDLGILAAGAVTCAMYTTSAVEQVAYIASHSGTRVVFAENEEQLDKLLEVRKRHPLERIIVFEDKGLRRFSDPAVELFEPFLARATQQLEADGEQVDRRVADIDPDQLAILVYTSGTTGPPKGVMLSHSNIAWACRALESVVEPLPDDEYLSFLPLCHVAERAITVFNQVLHATIVNFAENLDTVRENMSEVRPHVFFAVPRIWEKLYNAIELRMKDASWAKRQAYAWALATGRAASEHRQAAEARRASSRGADRAAGPASAEMPLRLRVAHQLADWTVLGPLRNKLGLDRTRFAISGAAPISAEVINYFQAIGVPLVEGYGLTESSAIISVNPPGFAPPGTVGLPMPGLELRIAEDGEILVRGPGVMLGYYRQSEATAETIDEDGWLHTGDVGKVDASGRLLITDRKKDLIITAGGKNIAPQYIESKLRLSPYVHDAIVIGDGRKYVTALVILDEDNLVEWAQEQRVQFGTYAELARSPQVGVLVQQEIDNTNETLTHVEAIKRFHILERRLDTDEGELTPTLKVRRKMVEEKYAGIIEQMY